MALRSSGTYCLTLAIMFFFFTSLVAAEVPEHNPSLDYNCGPGFQWSRGTVSCEQADCPPGAGRTYTYECNCGEAWDSNSPRVTCWENGMAVKCIPRGDKCEEYPNTFDVTTGHCAVGYEWDEDEGGCYTKGAPVLKCIVRDLDGNPVSGAIIKFSVYNRTDNTNRIGGGESITRDDGSYSQVLPSRGSYRVVVMAEPIEPPDAYRAVQEVKVRGDRVGACEITVYNNEQVEGRIKSEFEKFMREACFPEEAIEKIKNAKIKFGSDVANSQYSAEEKTLYVSGGDLRAGWDELQKALAHEFGHWISDNILDESSYYVKGIPLTGKVVGGSHDTWKPTKSDSWWIDPEKTAYEEAMAEFFALLYYKRMNLTYDPTLEDRIKAGEFLGEHPDSGHLTEGVIASFLYQYYKDSINDPSVTPGQVFGDFYHSTKNKVGGLLLGRLPRTAEEFIAARRKAERFGNWECKVYETGDLNQLAGDFRLTKEARARIVLEEGTEGDNPDNVKLSSNILKPKQEVTIPADSGLIAVQWSDYAKQREGKTPMAYFSREETVFQVSEDATSILIEKGKAYAVDANVGTRLLRLTTEGTEYVVEVTEDKESITVINGSVKAQDVDGKNTATIEQGKKVEYTPGVGFSEPEEADLNEVGVTWAGYAGKTYENDGTCCCIPLLPAAIALTASMLLGIPYAVKKKD